MYGIQEKLVMIFNEQIEYLLISDFIFIMCEASNRDPRIRMVRDGLKRYHELRQWPLSHPIWMWAAATCQIGERVNRGMRINFILSFKTQRGTNHRCINVVSFYRQKSRLKEQVHCNMYNYRARIKPFQDRSVEAQNTYSPTFITALPQTLPFATWSKAWISEWYQHVTNEEEE